MDQSWEYREFDPFGSKRVVNMDDGFDTGEGAVKREWGRVEGIMMQQKTKMCFVYYILLMLSTFLEERGSQPEYELFNSKFQFHKQFTPSHSVYPSRHTRLQNPPQPIPSFPSPLFPLQTRPCAPLSTFVPFEPFRSDLFRFSRGERHKSVET